MNYVVDHIPLNTAANRRPAFAMVPTTITIHNTGNPASTARNERAWLTNPSNDRTASFHIVVDEREAIECLPLNETAWHASDGRGDGNMRSISIEICESGDYAKALANAVDLTAKLLKERGWGVDRLRRHFDWCGKICPRLMYDGGTWAGWQTFKAAVDAKLTEQEDDDNMPMKLAEWQWAMLYEVLGKAYNDDKISWNWMQKIVDKTMTATELAFLNTVLDGRIDRKIDV